jgi:hypothetical protein
VTTLSTLEGAKALRKEFLEWQRDFYKSAKAEAAASPVKAYQFEQIGDRARINLFVNMLRRHQIEVYQLKKSMVAHGLVLQDKNTTFMVPVNQPQYRLIRTIFEKTLNYKDSLFYDITAWTMPLAFGLDVREFDTDISKDSSHYAKLSSDPVLEGKVEGGKSDYGYLIDWSDFFAPAALYELQSAGVVAKVATSIFSTLDRVKPFNYGTILVPVVMQNLSSDQLYTIVKRVAEKYGLVIQPIISGNSISGPDLGSSKFIPVAKPSIAMIVGTGVSATDAGEVWYLLDQRMNMPVTHLEISVFNRVELNKYNTLIMVGGTYTDLNRDKLKAWVQNGGTLILMEDAINWSAQNGISEIRFKKAKSPTDSIQRLAYTDREQIDGAQQIYGAIFGADIDLTHPLAYGYGFVQKTVSLFKADKVFMEKSKNPYATPFYYGSKPLQSGWVSRENGEAIKNSAAVIVNTVGNGRVINIADNPNFRAFWLGGTKLFMNSIFFGRIIDAAAGRYSEN